MLFDVDSARGAGGAARSPACTSYVEGSLTVVEKCRDGLLSRRDSIVTATGLPVRRESWVVRGGQSWLRQVRQYESAADLHYLVRRERYVAHENGSSLRRIRWTEVETGQPEIHDANGALVKRKLYDDDGSLAWIVEYRADGSYESIRRFGADARALLFDEEGRVQWTTDARGYAAAPYGPVAPQKSVYADGFYPDILSELASRGAALRLLFLGDSLTANWRGDGAAGDAVWQDYYADRDAMPAGIGSERTEHLLWRLDNGQLDGVAPDVLVLNIGTNNISAGDSASAAVDGIIACVARIRALRPDATIVLMGVFPRNDPASAADTKRRQVNLALDAWAATGDLLFRDLASDLTDASGTRIPALYADEVHLSSQGYARWAEAIEDSIAAELD